MKKNWSLGLVLMYAGFAQAQDPTIKDLQVAASKQVKSAEKDGWKKGGTLIININQGSLTNWASGGEQNTLGINAIFNYGINYRKGRDTWDNFFDLAIGFQNASSYGRFRKIDDRIDVTSKYGYQLNKKWYAGVLGNFNTQSLTGYDYNTNTKISNFLTPGKILASLGIDFRQTEAFSIFFSPVTSRWILKRDAYFFSLNKFGVPAYKKTYNELGAYLTAKFNKKINKWARYSGRVDLFSNYYRKPWNIDLFFTNLLSMKFNKWLGTTVSVDLLYDDDVIKRTQLKEILGIGLTVKL